ncbi:MAG: GNAT family N-acetyltransferase [Thermoproteota archaeon]
MNKAIVVRRASKEDAEDSANLILISAPSLFLTMFGDGAKQTIKYLFVQNKNLFSFEHAYVAEVEDKVAGIILGYNYDARIKESIRTGRLLLNHSGLKFITKFHSYVNLYSIGNISRDEYYISNLAVYPEYRGLGIGTRLIYEAENEAKRCELKRTALDVETDNEKAINFYRKLKYRISKNFTIKLNNKTFRFSRMYKELFVV